MGVPALERVIFGDDEFTADVVMFWFRTGPDTLVSRTFVLSRLSPKLSTATAEQRRNWQANAVGVRWPDIDEDLSLEKLFNNRK